VDAAGGTEGFIAPEMLAAYADRTNLPVLGDKADVYSLGKTIAELARDYRISVFPEFKLLLKAMCSKNYKKRPTMEQVYEIVEQWFVE
jgi:hypothetical protein